MVTSASLGRDASNSTRQRIIIKCNLSSKPLLVQHKTTKDLSVVSKTEPSQEVKIRSLVCAEHKLSLLRKARQIFQDFEKKTMRHQRMLELLEPNFPNNHATLSEEEKEWEDDV